MQLALCLCVFVISLSATAPSRRPPIILITVDTLRADRLSPYGGRLVTPGAQSLAADGTVFEDAVAASPLTLPAHATIFTSLDPPLHGVRDNGGFALEENRITLAEVLREHDYKTAAFVSSYVLNPATGITQGFEFVDADFRSELDETPEPLEQRARFAVDKALRWTAQVRPPFFLWLHLYDPHETYRPPEPFRSRYANRYDGEVAYADSEVNRLLEFLRRQNLYQPSLLIYTSDHGESLGEHKEQTHGFFLYQSTLRVPLIIKLPGDIRARGRSRVLARQVDLMPTTLRAAGLPVPAFCQGFDLFSSRLSADAYSETLYSYLNFGWSALVSLRWKQYKFIRSPRPELYDLQRDTHEKHNLFSERAALAATLSARLDDKLRLQAASAAERSTERPSPELRKIDPAVEARLRSLGYVSLSTARPPENIFAGPDPKERVNLFEAINRDDPSLGLQPEKAVQKLEHYLKDEPANGYLWTLLGMNLFQMQKYQDALGAFSQAIKFKSTSSRARLFAGLSLFQLKRFGEAEAALTKLLQSDPRNYRARLSLGILFQETRRTSQAIAEFREAVKLNPAAIDARERLISSLQAAGKKTEAELEMSNLKQLRSH